MKQVLRKEIKKSIDEAKEQNKSKNNQ